MSLAAPQVSVLIASFNHAPFIGAAIDSVLAQDFENWELIVCDDASTDQTRAVLHAYRDPRIQCVFHDINRQHHMRNRAYARARGEFIALLNSDDLFRPGKLRRQVEAMRAHPEVLAVFTHASCIDDDGREIDHAVGRIFNQAANRPRHAWLRHFFETGNALCLPSAMIRRSALPSRDPFDTRLIQVSDLDLWIRVCLQGEIQLIPEPLTAMRVLKSGGNLSAPGRPSSNRLLAELIRVYDRFVETAALAQFEQIFTDLSLRLPEPVNAWRTFLLAQHSIALPHLAPRLFGVALLQELLGRPEQRADLERHHPRLMRDYASLVGAAGLDPAARMCLWQFEWTGKEPVAFWRDSLSSGLLTFSLPVQHDAPTLVISAPASAPGVVAAVRVFGQQSGELLADVAANGESSIRIDVDNNAARDDVSIYIEVEVRPRSLFRRLLKQAWRDA